MEDETELELAGGRRSNYFRVGRPEGLHLPKICFALNAGTD